MEISSDSNSDEDLGHSSKIKKHNATRHKPKYRKEWENLPEFKFWLTRDSNNECNAKCTVCGKVMVSEVSTIKRHGKTAKHKELQNKVSDKQKSIMNRFIQAKGKSFYLNLNSCI